MHDLWKPGLVQKDPWAAFLLFFKLPVTELQRAFLRGPKQRYYSLPKTPTLEVHSYKRGRVVSKFLGLEGWKVISVPLKSWSPVWQFVRD